MAAFCSFSGTQPPTAIAVISIANLSFVTIAFTG
jgi:hypothetical protein